LCCILEECKYRSYFFFQAEDGIRDPLVTGVQTCALPISSISARSRMKLSITPSKISRRKRGDLMTSILCPRPRLSQLSTQGASRSEERRVGKECRVRRWRE